MHIGNGRGKMQQNIFEHVIDSHSSWEICLSMRQISLRERVEIA